MLRIAGRTHKQRSIMDPFTCDRPIGLVGRVFANGPGDRGSIPGRIIPKTQKMVLDATLLNIQHYMVRIKGKWSITLLYISV